MGRKKVKETKIEYLNRISEEFKTCTCPRRRDKIFIDVAAIYENYIFKKVEGYSKYERDAVISQYYVEVLDCLRLWEGRCSIKTYIYPRLKAVFRKYFREEAPTIKGGYGDEFFQLPDEYPNDFDAIEAFESDNEDTNQVPDEYLTEQEGDDYGTDG